MLCDKGSLGHRFLIKTQVLSQHYFVLTRAIALLILLGTASFFCSNDEAISIQLNEDQLNRIQRDNQLRHETQGQHGFLGNRTGEKGDGTSSSESTLNENYPYTMATSVELHEKLSASDPSFLKTRGPLIVCGMDGSGTRSVQHMITAGGIHMGGRVTKDGDTHACMLMKAPSVVPELLKLVETPNYEIHDLESSTFTQDIYRTADQMIKLLQKDLIEYLHTHNKSPAPSTVWGWKGPRQMYFLPFLEALMPHATIVYVTRDVRDLSSNTTSYARFGSGLDAFPDYKHEQDPMRQKVWEAANYGLAVHDWCKKETRKIKCVFQRVEDLSSTAYVRLAVQQNIQALYSNLQLDEPKVGFEQLSSAADKCLGSNRDQGTVRACGGYGKWRTDPVLGDKAMGLMDIEGVVRFLEVFGYE